LETKIKRSPVGARGVTFGVDDQIATTIYADANRCSYRLLSRDCMAVDLQPGKRDSELELLRPGGAGPLGTVVGKIAMVWGRCCLVTFQAFTPLGK